VRIIIACCTLVAASFLHVQLAAADGIGDWPLLHWGMTRQQVERAYPYFGQFITAPGEVVFGLKSHIAAGCEFTVGFDFDHNNRLYNVHLIAPRRRIWVGDHTKADATEAELKAWAGACRRAKDVLIKRYGPPRRTDDLSGMTFLHWDLGETIVTYINHGEKDDCIYLCFTLVYSNDPDGKEHRLLFR
jgi:hypothetical protein